MIVSNLNAVPVSVTKEPVELAVPLNPLIMSRTLNLRARLMNESGSELIASWDFVVNPNGKEASLKLCPEKLDQGFLLLEHSTSPPLARNFQRNATPVKSGRYLLYLEIPELPSANTMVYRVSIDPRALEHNPAWGQIPDPVIDWFYVELTNHCNLSCPFCPSSQMKRSRTFMSPSLAEQIFSKIGEYVSSHARFVGYVKWTPLVFLHVMGEPLLNPKFEHCVRIARDHGLTLALFTNTSLLTMKNIARILDSGVEHVTLSMNVIDDSACRDLGVRGGLPDQERKALDFLQARASRKVFNIHVDLQYMASANRAVAGSGLLQTNSQFWSLYSRWLQLIRQSFESLTPETAGPKPVPESDNMENPLAIVDDASLRFPLMHGVDLAVKSGCTFGNVMLPDQMEVIPTKRGTCPFGNPFRQLAIFADGKVSFCSMDHEASATLGDLSTDSIMQIWQSARLRRIRSEMMQTRLSEPLCQRCLGKIRPVSKMRTAAEGVVATA